MKKKIVIFICIIVGIICINFTTAFAESTFKTNVSLCSNDVVYFVDYIYDVFNVTNIVDVTVSNTNYTCEWKFNQSESKFYLSISSDTPIAMDKTIATITWIGDDICSLIVPFSMQVNGTSNVAAYDYHKIILMDWIEPGIDTPGYWNGSKCLNCGIIIEEPREIPPKGPSVKVTLNDKGTLTVSGSLSDESIAKGTTFLSVYNKDKIMISIKNITDLDQSNFSIAIDNVSNPATVRILRWNMENLKPLYNAVEFNIEN